MLYACKFECRQSSKIFWMVSQGARGAAGVVVGNALYSWCGKKCQGRSRVALLNETALEGSKEAGARVCRLHSQIVYSSNITTQMHTCLCTFPTWLLLRLLCVFFEILPCI